MIDLFIGSSEGYDANGSPIEYYHVSCKKFKREFETQEELQKWLKAYIEGNLTECVKYGKLKSVLSEID